MQARTLAAMATSSNLVSNASVCLWLRLLAAAAAAAITADVGANCCPFYRCRVDIHIRLAQYALVPCNIWWNSPAGSTPDLQVCALPLLQRLRPSCSNETSSAAHITQLYCQAFTQLLHLAHATPTGSERLSCDRCAVVGLIPRDSWDGAHAILPGTVAAFVQIGKKGGG